MSSIPYSLYRIEDGCANDAPGSSAAGAAGAACFSAVGEALEGGVAHEFGAFEAEFAAEVAAVGFHRVHGELERFGNLEVAEALADQMQHRLQVGREHEAAGLEQGVGHHLTALIRQREIQDEQIPYEEDPNPFMREWLEPMGTRGAIEQTQLLCR